MARLVLFPWDICFALWLGMRKQPQLGLFLQGMGSFFMRPTCLPQSSAKALFQRDLVEVVSILGCVEIPLALRSIAAASKGPARRAQIVPKLHRAKTSHGIEAVITETASSAVAMCVSDE